MIIVVSLGMNISFMSLPSVDGMGLESGKTIFFRALRKVFSLHIQTRLSVHLLSP
jgi:hypothetical protein